LIFPRFRCTELFQKSNISPIGYRFINTGTVTENQIKNKLMFFIWDSVFNRDKKPLRELLGNDKELVTFGDFIKSHKEFVEKLLDYRPKSSN
jgi:hypothetical protein